MAELLALPRGGIRTNLSGLPTAPINLTDDIQEIMQDILYRGLRFNSDRVEFVYHTDKYILDSKGVMHNVEFYPLDKDLDKAEIEAINEWRYGFGLITATPISRMVEIMANLILRKINASFNKKEVAKVVVHFAPGDYIAEPSIAKLGYCYVGQSQTDGRNLLEVETSFYIEEFFYEEPEIEDN